MTPVQTVVELTPLPLRESFLVRPLEVKVADVITVIGTAEGVGSEILGNAGGDVITVSAGLRGTSNLLGAGSGNDTITFSGAVLDSAASIVGGGGVDQFTFTSADTYLGVFSVVLVRIASLLPLAQPRMLVLDSLSIASASPISPRWMSLPQARQ